MVKRIHKTSQLSCFQDTVNILFLCPRGEVSSMFAANQFQTALGQAGIANKEVGGGPRREAITISLHPPVDAAVGDISNRVRMTLTGNITIDRGASHPGKQLPPDEARRQLMSVHTSDGTPLQSEAGAPRAYDYVVIHDREHYPVYAETAEKMDPQPQVLQYEDCTNWVGWRSFLDVYSPLIELIRKNQEEKGNHLHPVNQ